MRKRNSWFWNVVIVITLIGCAFAFGLHYKNWTNIEDAAFKVKSGIYSQKIPLTKINGIEFVPKIPEMERENGFSWLAREKGVFKDSITGGSVYVFVDDLRQQKIKITHNDSLQLYFNLSDSLKTRALYETLQSEILSTE